MKKLKTMTLSRKDTDEPGIVLLRGHVDVKTFNRAFRNEGWNSDSYTQDEISYEYWRRLKSGVWKDSLPGRKNAEPVTVHYWQ